MPGETHPLDDPFVAQKFRDVEQLVDNVQQQLDATVANSPAISALVTGASLPGQVLQQASAENQPKEYEWAYVGAASTDYTPDDLSDWAGGLDPGDIADALDQLAARLTDEEALGDGDVFGPASSTDNALARFNLATGKLIQNSGILCSDANALTGAGIDADNNALTNIGLVEFDMDVTDTFDLFFGSSIDMPVVTVAVDTGVIKLSLEHAGGGDLRFHFSGGIHTHDCTPADTVSLSAGPSDASPVENYVFIDQGTKLLTANTTGFPATEAAHIARVFCQTAATLDTDGAMKVHAYTDHVDNADGGMLKHINAWIRLQPATWASGVTLTPTITINGGAEDNIDISTTSGVIHQLHDHTFPAFNTATGSDVYIVNKSGAAYTKVTDLNDADEDDAGNPITTNRWTSLVVAGVVSQDTADCKLLLNQPSDFYKSSADAIADAFKYANYTFPDSFVGTVFLIARLTLKFSAAAGGTWTLEENLDLRGSRGGISAGGSSAASTEFLDTLFLVHDETDETKHLQFECSGITTATTRTLTVPDLDGTIMLNVVEDTTPQAGGTFDMNGNPLQFGDNISAEFGDAQDATIQYDGSNLRINPDAVGSGALIVGGQMGLMGTSPSTTHIFRLTAASSTIATAMEGSLSYSGSDTTPKAMDFTLLVNANTSNLVANAAGGVAGGTHVVPAGTSSTMRGGLFSGGSGGLQNSATATLRCYGSEFKANSGGLKHTAGNLLLASVFGNEPVAASGTPTSETRWAGLFTGNVQIISNKRLILEGSATVEGDAYVMFDSSGVTIGFFLNATEEMNIGVGEVNIINDLHLDGDLNHDGSNVGFFAVAPAAQPAHIVDADGTLADITTKFNTLLAQVATLGLQAAA